MKVSMTVKQAKALVALVEENDSRWYCNVICVTIDGDAVVSNSYTLLKMRVAVEGWERDTHLKGSALATSLKIAVAMKSPTVTVECDEDNTMHGVYPPFALAFPQKETLIGTYDVSLLLGVLKGIKDACPAKTSFVGIYQDRDNGTCRPLLLRDAKEESSCGLVVSCRL
jgi:hypothetical protein